VGFAPLSTLAGTTFLPSLLGDNREDNSMMLDVDLYARFVTGIVRLNPTDLHSTEAATKCGLGAGVPSYSSPVVLLEGNHGRIRVILLKVTAQHARR
jgi:hypothetical protein